MTKEIEIDIKKYGGCKIAVALSGGRDSIALAYALINSGANFFAVNVEHGIRGEASVADSKFVKDFCDKNNIELLSFSVDSLKFSADSGMTVEQSARALRYDIFDSLLADCKCDYVALAHHRDDQVETIVMRILRGTGLRGLTAMKEQNGKYIRPLLNYTREDIDEFVKAHNLQYVDDETNSDTAYTRNYLREQLKVIRLRYPSFDEAILRLSRNADEAENFIDKFVGEPKLVDGEAFVACADLAEIAVAKRLILKASASVGVFQDIEERHFPLILGLVTAQNRKRIELPHGLTAQKDGDFIKFSVNANANAKAVEIDCNAELTNANSNGLQTANVDTNANVNANVDINAKANSSVNINVKANVNVQEIDLKTIEIVDVKSIDSEAGALFADADKIPKNAVWRYRQDGDKITKFGGGTKSLGDFLTDKKVPFETRDSLKLLCDGNDVLVVLGVEISNKIKVETTTKHIVKISKAQ